MSAMIAGRLIDDLRAQGVTVVAVGDVLRVRAPRGAITDDLRKRLREHKSALLELLREGPAEDDPRSHEANQSQLNVRCFTCRRSRLWISVYGVAVCAVCHPPAAANLVASWFEEK